MWRDESERKGGAAACRRTVIEETVPADVLEANVALHLLQVLAVVRAADWWWICVAFWVGS